MDPLENQFLCEAYKYRLIILATSDMIGWLYGKRLNHFLL